MIGIFNAHGTCPGYYKFRFKSYYLAGSDDVV